MKKVIFASLFLLGLTVCSYASSPVLYFTDITSGPKSGNSDNSLGQTPNEHGCIVTIWGKNLGSSQGSSTVTCNGAVAPYIYSWGNATAPADLYTYHGMQMISFQVSGAAADGLGTISVTIGGVTSNTLPFTVRSGAVRFIKTTGSDVGDGTWVSPWRTILYATNNHCSAGDIVYVCDGVSVSSANGVCVYGPSGTENNPISLIAYPGATVTASNGGSRGAITNWSGATSYWNFAKLYLTTNITGAYSFTGSRFVGLNITGPNADGQMGAITTSGYDRHSDNVKCYGNYIHDFGNDSTSKLHHVFYLSNRTGTQYRSYELGWNYLKDNKAYHGLHVYDEGIGGDWSGTMRIHDNVVVNQRGAAFSFAGGTFTMPVEVYNNIFINCGLGPIFPDGNLWACAVYINPWDSTTSTIKFYNNTIYGYSDDTVVQTALARKTCLVTGTGTGYSYEWINNIVVDTKDISYIDDADTLSKPPSGVRNNIWYNGGNGSPGNPPDWDGLAIVTDPKFVNISGDFHIQSSSSARDSGYAVALVQKDFDGNVRPAGSAYDIGAYEYVSGCALTSESVISTSSSGSDQCFIATAVYPEHAPEKEILVAFRDKILLKSRMGRNFVSFYYSHSPCIAKYLERRNWAKVFIRIVLHPFILTIQRFS